MLSIERIAEGFGATIYVFNNLPVKRKGDVVAIKARRVNQNALLIVIFVPKNTVVDVLTLFEAARGERAAFHGDWFAVPEGAYYIETYSDQDLSTCDLRASVLDFIDIRIDKHVVEQLG
jgi:hypothetical protein